MKKKLMISACLLGYQCNYKNQCDKVYKEAPSKWNQLFDDFEVLPVCPEQLGGMTTPRIPSELTGSVSDVFSGKEKVISQTGQDVTDNFLKGANEVLRIAKIFKPDYIILKSKSPSCGSGKIYDGSFTGKLIEGYGVTAWILKENGFNVKDELQEIS